MNATTIRRLSLVVVLAASACVPAEDGGGALATASRTQGLGHGYEASLVSSRPLQGGQTTELSFFVRDAAGDPVEDFELEHTRRFHLIIVSDDLIDFAHLHPTYAGEGRFDVAWTPPEFDQRYHFYAQFKPAGASLQTLRFSPRVAGLSIRTPVPVVADAVDFKTDGPNTLVLLRPELGFETGDQTLRFEVRDTESGALAQDLTPYLGAKAHIIAVKAYAEGRVFLHGHASGPDAPQGGGHGGAHGGHAEHEGPAESWRVDDGALSFDLHFPEAGTYRLWIQYARQGQEFTQQFTLDVN